MAGRPGWHGLPPGAARDDAPLVGAGAGADPADVYETTENAPPIWVALACKNGSTQRAKGFGMAWTKDKRLVRAKWVEHSIARHTPAEGNKKPPAQSLCPAFQRFVVELRGFEPLTPCMPCRCATSCAIAPYSRRSTG